MGNAHHLLNVLEKRRTGTGGFCSCGTRHSWCTAKTARRAAIHALKLCKTILTGLGSELRQRGEWTTGSCGTHAVFEEALATIAFPSTLVREACLIWRASEKKGGKHAFDDDIICHVPQQVLSQPRGRTSWATSRSRGYDRLYKLRRHVLNLVDRPCQ